MPQSLLRLVRRCAEFRKKDDVSKLPHKLRGIYVLYQYDSRLDKYNVVYVGMAKAGKYGGMKGRLSSHSVSNRKADQWSHFSVFEVWDNIRDDEVAELEGLFRHIYRRDAQANALNIQRGYKKLKMLQKNRLEEWHVTSRDGKS